MEMCCFNSEENSSEEEEEEEDDDEDSSILTTLKTSSKADNNKIIMGINDFNNSSEEEESSILFTSSKFHMQWQREAINSVIQKAILEAEYKDVKVLSLGLLNQEEGLNGNGELFIRRHPKLKVKLIVLALCQSGIKVLGTMPEDEYKKLKEKLSKDQQKPTFWFPEFASKNKTLPLNLFALHYLPDKSLALYSSVSDQWIKSQLHQSYYFVQYDACGVPSSSLRFLPDFLNLRLSSNGLLLEPAVIFPFEASVLNKSANYQLICALPSFGLQIVCFKLYSSETKIWSESNTIYLELGDDTEFTGNGFYMKGMVYWQTRVKDMKNETYQMKVSSFDMD